MDVNRMIYIKHGKMILKGDGDELLAEICCLIQKLADMTGVDAGQLGADIVNNILKHK